MSHMVQVPLHPRRLVTKLPLLYIKYTHAIMINARNSRYNTRPDVIFHI